jgi:hypothetical protein
MIERPLDDGTDIGPILANDRIQVLFIDRPENNAEGYKKKDR